MSNTVDNRVVEMQFDNAQFEKNVQTSIGTLDQLKQSLRMDGVADGITVIAQKFSAFEAIAAGALFRIGSQIVDTGEKLIKSLTIDQISAGWEKFADKTTAVQTIMAATRETWQDSANAMARTQWLIEKGVDKSLASGLAKQSDDIKNGVISIEDAVTNLGGTYDIVLSNLTNRMTGIQYQGDQMRFVNEQLERLNWFTDETSYKLIDMSNNIGKFTSAGVGLEDAVSAMEGIANWAAISGGNANSASIAMYNMSQALGSGAVLAVDWKSIENQNMATAEFKQIVIDTAAELGTLEKVSEGVYKTMEGNEVTVKNFRENLKDRWFNDAVLMGSLQKYGDFAVELQQVAAETDLSAKELLDNLDAYKTAAGGMADFLVKEGINENLAEGVASRYKQIASGMMTMEQAAEELGTTPAVISNLTNRLDGFMSGAVDFEAMLEEIKETCPDTTLTIEDLRKEFNLLTDDTMDLGMRAFKAAQEAKTFQEAIDYVREAVSTGWLKTFELIFGNYKEAKELWSNLAEEFYTIFVESGDVRNSILKEWKALGGRDDLVEAFWNIFHAITAIIQAIREAISDVFNPLLSDTENGASRLKELTARLKEFSEMLKLTDDETGELNETGQKIKSTFKGVFAIFGIVKDVLTALIKPIFQLIPGMGDLGSGILDATANLGDMLVAFRETINSSEFLEEVTKRLSDSYKALSDFVGNMMEIFRGVSYWEAGGGFAGVLESMFDSLNNVVKLIFDVLSAITGKDFSQIRDNVVETIWAIRDVVVNNLGPAGEVAKQIFQWIKDSVVDLWDSLETYDLSGSLDNIKGSLQNFSEAATPVKETVEKIKMAFKKAMPYIGGILKGIGAIFLGAGAIFAEFGRKIGSFLKEASILDIVNFIKGLAEAFLMFKAGNFLKSITNFPDTVNDFVEALKSFTEGLKSSAEKLGSKVMKFALSMAILAGAIYLISKIDTAQLIVAGGVIATLMYLMSVVTKDMGTKTGKGEKFNSATTQMLAFSVSILILAKAIKKIADINPTQLATSVFAIGILMMAMYAVTDQLSKRKSKDVGSGLSQLMAMAAGVLILSMAIKKISSLNVTQLGLGVAAISIMLAELTVAMHFMSNNGMSGKQILANSVYILAFAIAVKKLAKVLIDLAAISWEGMAKGVVGLSVIIAELVIATNLMKKTKDGAKAMTASAIALLIFVGVIKLMAAMKWETIGKGLLAIAACFVTLAISAALCTPVISIIERLSKSLWKIGVGLLAMAAAIVIFSVAAPLFYLSAGLIGKGLVILLTELITAIPQLISALVESLYQSAEDIVNFIVAVIGLICAAIRSSIGDIVDTLMFVIVETLNSIADQSEAITAALIDIFILGPLKGIADRIPEITSTLANIIEMTLSSLIDALSSLGNGNLLDTLAAIDTLEKIMWKLSVIAGMAWITSGSLPKVGTKLAEFGENIAPFFRSLRIVSAAHIMASESLARMLVILTSANVRDALTSWFTGENRLKDLGQQLADFAPYLSTYARNIKNMDPQKVIDSVPAIEALSRIWIYESSSSGDYEELAKALDVLGPALGTYSTHVVDFPIDDVLNSAKAIVTLNSAMDISTVNLEDIELFGDNLVAFGKALQKYSVVIAFIDVPSILASMTVAEAISSFDQGIGVQGWNLFTGDVSMSAFGDNLVAFGKALQKYSIFVANLNITDIMASMEVAKVLNEIDSNVKNQSWNLFSGDKSLKTFGENLVEFGKALVGYSMIVPLIDSPAITASMEAARAIIDLDSSVTKNQRGTLFSGNKTLGKFAENLNEFGKSLVSYSMVISFLNSAGIIASIEPAKAIIDLDSSVTKNQRGTLFSGNKTLGKFAENLTSFGLALSAYSTAVSFLNAPGIIASIEPAKAIIDLDSGVTKNQTWNLFTGDKSLGAFGDNLSTFGMALVAYSTEVALLNIPAIMASIEPAKAIMEIDKVDKNQKWNLFTGDKTLGSFGENLSAFGLALVAYSTAVAYLNVPAIMASIEPANALIDTANSLSLKYVDTYTLVTMGQDLVSFGEGLMNFTQSIADIDTTVFARVRTALNILTSIKINELVPVLESMEDLLDVVFTIDSYGSENIDALSESLTNFAKTGIEDFAAAFSDSDAVSEAVSGFVTTAIQEIDNSQDDFKTAASDLVSEFINKITFELGKHNTVFNPTLTNMKNQITAFKTSFGVAGALLVSGFANGIKNNTWKANDAARALARSAYEAAKKESEINSPSKKFYEIGSGDTEGFVNALRDGRTSVYKAGAELADSAYKGTSEAIKRLASYVDTEIDSQPTIRPVLDLTDVTNGFGQLNTMLSRKQAVGISASMDRIGSVEVNENGSAPAFGNSYNFVQNNYSPKALSTSEIYRQTKNQFSLVKGRVNSRR